MTVHPSTTPPEAVPPVARLRRARLRRGAWRAGRRARGSASHAAGSELQQWQAGEHEKAAANGARRSRSDPEQVSTNSAGFHAALERETAASLRKDPERWRFGRTADRDEHRRKPRRTTGRRAGL
jgi:hypothetical protein